MIPKVIPRDATNVLLAVLVLDSSDDPVTGLAHDTAGLSVNILAEGGSSESAATLVAGTVGTYLANSWVEIGNGLYQFCPANSAIAASKWTVFRVASSGNPDAFVEVSAVGYPASQPTVTVGSIPTTLQQQLQDNLSTLAFIRKRATDWTFDINIGDISGLSWGSMLFTLKASPTEDVDADALLQVKLTNGGDPGDGLQVLNGAAAGTASDGEIEVVDNERAVVTILAQATEVIDPTDSKFWSYTGPITQSMLAWRRTQAATKPVPPVYQFDVKILNGGGSAETVPASGTLIVPEIVTRTVA